MRPHTHGLGYEISGGWAKSVIKMEQLQSRHSYALAAEICDAWALKKGFLTAKAGRPDNYRAANSILRMALAGQITLSLFPPDFVSNEGMAEPFQSLTLHIIRSLTHSIFYVL